MNFKFNTAAKLPAQLTAMHGHLIPVFPHEVVMIRKSVTDSEQGATILVVKRSDEQSEPAEIPVKEEITEVVLMLNGHPSKAMLAAWEKEIVTKRQDEMRVKIAELSKEREGQLKNLQMLYERDFGALNDALAENRSSHGKLKISVEGNKTLVRAKAILDNTKESSGFIPDLKIRLAKIIGGKDLSAFDKMEELDAERDVLKGEHMKNLEEKHDSSKALLEKHFNMRLEGMEKYRDIPTLSTADHYEYDQRRRVYEINHMDADHKFSFDREKDCYRLKRDIDRELAEKFKARKAAQDGMSGMELSREGPGNHGPIVEDPYSGRLARRSRERGRDFSR